MLPSRRASWIRASLLPTSPASATSLLPRPCPARCRSGRIRRSVWRTACMPSSFPARPLPRRATSITAAGCTAFVRPPCTSRLCRFRMPRSTTASRKLRPRRTSCAGIRCRCRTRRRTLSMVWSRWRATAARMNRRGLASTSIRPIARCKAVFSTVPTASC